jgi:hypothetical protein
MRYAITGLLLVFPLLALYFLMPWAILSRIRLGGFLLVISFLTWLPFFFFFFYALYTNRVTGSGIQHVAGSFHP